MKIPTFVQKNKTVLIGAAIVLTVTAVYYFGFHNKGEKSIEEDKPEAEAEGSTGGQPQKQINNKRPMGNDSLPLKMGSNGNRVKKLQTVLNSKYNAGIAVDGSFGSGTLAVVKNKLGVESVDEKTYTSLVNGKALPSDKKTSSIEIKKGDVITAKVKVTYTPVMRLDKFNYLISTGDKRKFEQFAKIGQVSGFDANKNPLVLVSDGSASRLADDKAIYLLANRNDVTVFS